MNEKTLEKKTIYEGRVLTLEVLDIEAENGVKSMREVIRHSGAVAVLPVLPDGTILLVRQYRKAIEREVLEVVAGLLEEGETPEACARRELKEETGYSAESLTRVGAVHPSPGYTDEKIELFFARLMPESGDVRPDEDERLEVLRLTQDEVRDRIEKGEIQDGKTLAAWLLCEKMLAASADQS